MKLTSLSIAAVIGLLHSLPASSAPAYTFTVLTGISDEAYGINITGQVAGTVYTPPFGQDAIVWAAGTTTDLGRGAGVGINDSGQVAGYSIGANGYQQATLWTGTTKTYLTPLPTSRTSISFGLAVNNAGQVAGYSTSGSQYHAALWTGTAATDLGTLGGTTSYAFGINAVGQVVGESLLAGDFVTHATLWSGTTKTDLGALSGNFSAAAAINSAGLITGNSSLADGSHHATLWNGTTLTDIGTLAGTGVDSFGDDINDSGDIVGYINPHYGFIHAVLWENGTMIDLNSLLDPATVAAGWILEEATGINNSGWITGDAVNTMTNEGYAFVLSPFAAATVPEPGTLALAGAGMVFMLRTRRRVATRRA